MSKIIPIFDKFDKIIAVKVVVQKKPVCPKCNKEINKLNVYSKGIKCARLLLDDRTPNDKHEFEPDDANQFYNCPECGETLFTDNEEAIKFLSDDYMSKKIRIVSVEPIEGTIIDHFKKIKNIKDVEGIL